MVQVSLNHHVIFTDFCIIIFLSLFCKFFESGELDILQG